MVRETRRVGGSLFERLGWKYFPVFCLVFLVSALNVQSIKNSEAIAGGGILGGPGDAFSTENSDGVAVVAAPSIDFETAAVSRESINIASGVSSGGVYLANTGSVFGGILRVGDDGFFVYKVQRGDTVSKIAANFNISLETVKMANPSLKDALKPDTEITILPVSGALYTTISGDTLESVAQAFGADPSRIMEVNKMNTGDYLGQGLLIVIPDAKPKQNLDALAKASRALPSIPGYFIFPMPKNSLNWGKLHANNAVDIANSCGTPIYAAADGLVTETGSPDNWNGGYGRFVKIEHPNGTETLYAHIQKILADQGSFVSQGDTIAEVGETGNVHGPTGCHLHFEVYKAKNPFLK